MGASDLARGDDGKLRCAWCAAHDDYIAYHDDEWGFPVGDDQRLFEKVCLEGFQSGLSWLTILRKREAFRRSFAEFDFRDIARFGPRHVERMLKDAAIVRHRGKIESAIGNARRAISLIDEFGSIAAYVWRFEPPPAPDPTRRTTSPEAIALSNDLKKRGWTFVGPTTIDAFMQATGLVNDHLRGCAARVRAEEARKAFLTIVGGATPATARDDPDPLRRRESGGPRQSRGSGDS
jgi:DNA-3-methyladenine glycosylase I